YRSGAGGVKNRPLRVVPEGREESSGSSPPSWSPVPGRAPLIRASPVPPPACPARPTAHPSRALRQGGSGPWLQSPAMYSPSASPPQALPASDAAPGLLRMTAPLIVSFWMRSLFTFVDTFYAAWLGLGDAPVAAIGLSIPFEFVMAAVWLGLST